MPIVPFAVWKPVPSHSGTMAAHQGLVLHVQVGNGSCYGEFEVPANQASSTWWVSKAGVLEQYVDSDDAAWTEAAGNFTWDSVETEGEPTEPLTAQQVATLALLYAWGVAQYGWPVGLAETPDDHGFGWHGMGGVAWGNHPDCPGDLRRPQRQDILNAVGNPTPPPPPEVPVPVAAPIVFAGQFHVFQVNGASLWHKWSADGEKWGNENVFTAAGVGQPGLPNQFPGVTVSGSNLLVAVEDNAGKAWFFKQPSGGAWGASTLP